MLPKHQTKPSTLPGVKGWRKTFSSLQVRDYRWYWASNVSGFFGFQMQLVARGWLIYNMTDSALLLGIVTAAWALPTLIIGPFGGVIADRVEKRNLILLNQTMTVLISLAITILIVIDAIQVWHLLAASILSGVIFSLNMPARQAIVPELVGEERLTNAIALNSSGMNVTKIVGPALAGILVGVIGIPGVYMIITGCYAGTVLGMAKVPRTGITLRKEKRNVLSDIAYGFRYVRHHLTIRVLLILEFIVNFLGWPYMMLMPVFARDVFGRGASSLGLLMSAIGVGSLFGSLGLAYLGEFKRRGFFLLGLFFVFGVGLILFSNCETFNLALFSLLIVGGVSTASFALNNTLILGNVEHEVRGRVMSIYMMTWTAEAIGVLPLGALAEAKGVSFAVSLDGALLVLLTVIIAATVPQLRKL
ncbi:MAG: MFS transporter [Dehalococcoidia bacterium]|nr:MFS transporter [Dehalococcoidia bacterium]